MNKKLLFTLSVFLVLFLIKIPKLSAQEKCATNHKLEQEKAKSPSQFLLNRTKLEEYIAQFADSNNQASRSFMSTMVIPTIVHVVHNGESEGTYPNISEDQILSGINNLNDAFRNEAVYAGSSYYNSPMEVMFVLAKVKPDGTPTSGIERHDISSKSYANEYFNNGIRAYSASTGAAETELMEDYYWNPQDYMNIWLVNKIDGIDIGTGATGVLGYATTPVSSNGVTDGLVCQVRAFGYDPDGILGYDFGTTSSPANRNGTANHEVGHYLSLYHTFEGDEEGTICPDDIIVGENSDGCDDIPPHKRTDSECPDDDLTTGNECVPGGDNNFIHNFMNYSLDECFTGFSVDQKTRVEAALSGPRSAFGTSIATQNGEGDYPVATIATVSNPDTTTGINEITLNGNTFNSLNGYYDGGYLNRVASQPTVILEYNTSYTMTVQVGVNDEGVNSELVDVYIDYNANGIFDSGELIYQTPGGSGKDNGDVFSFSFTTPTPDVSIPNKSRLRMRVISDFDDGVNTIASALSTDFGQIEDYSVSFGFPTLIQEDIVQLSNLIKVYPNPASDNITIQNAGNIDISSITLVDINGRIIDSFSINSTTKRIDLSVEDYASGVYFLKIASNENSITKKVIIK